MKKRRKLNTEDFLARTVSLLARDRYPGRQFSSSEILIQACLFYWSKSSAGKTFLRWQPRFQRWLESSGLDHSLYRCKVAILQKLPLPDPRAAPGVAPGPKKVGYYLWQYPVQSQTFVQRELAALCRSGSDIVVFSEIEPEDEFISELKPFLAAAALVVPACSGEELRLIRRRFFRRHPVRFLRIYGYVAGQRYHVIKNRRFDENTFNGALKIASLAEQHGVRHLHAPWADNCAFIALLASRMLGISYSVQARAHDIHRNSYKYGLWQKFENAEFVVSNTVYNVNHIRSILSQGLSEKVSHIYNGLNLEQFDVRRKLRNGGSEIRLLCVARLIEQKGLIYLLQACRSLLDSGLNFRCDIVGGVEEIYMNYYVRLLRLHRALGLKSNVHFTGPVSFEGVLAFYREADIFVLPCVLAEDGSRDIIPNSVLEAMAMKLPVVSTIITGLPEMVAPGETGYLVPPGDAEALAGAIQKLADSPQLRYEFGNAGRQRVEQFFDSKKNVQAYQRLFSGTLSS